MSDTTEHTHTHTHTQSACVTFNSMNRENSFKKPIKYAEQKYIVNANIEISSSELYHIHMYYLYGIVHM